jgi:hypothetical protein
MDFLAQERRPDSEETKAYRGHTIEIQYFHKPSETVSMYAYVTKGSTRTLVDFSPEMPTRDFATKEHARKAGITCARREIDAIIGA